MEKLIKARTPVRVNFTKTHKTVMIETDTDKVRLQLVKLEHFGAQLKDVDEKILEKLLDDEDASTYDTEYDKIQTYYDQLDEARQKLVCLLTKREVNDSASDRSMKRKLELPKIELRKFDGEVRNWLGFWSQFSRIHNDADVEREDKFQYLIQATTEGSRARDVVTSFPPTAENYEKAVQCLQNRFGRKELLVEFYVRELLGLVI